MEGTFGFWLLAVINWFGIHIMLLDVVAVVVGVVTPVVKRRLCIKPGVNLRFGNRGNGVVMFAARLRLDFGTISIKTPFSNFSAVTGTPTV